MRRWSIFRLHRDHLGHEVLEFMGFVDKGRSECRADPIDTLGSPL